MALASELTLPTVTEVSFTSDLVLTNTFDVMAKDDAIIEDIECYDIDLVAVGTNAATDTTAADALGSVASTTVCIIDATCK